MYLEDTATDTEDLTVGDDLQRLINEPDAREKLISMASELEIDDDNINKLVDATFDIIIYER